MSPTRLSKVNHRKHVVGELRGIRVLDGDDVQTEDCTLGVFEEKLLALVKEVDQKMVQQDEWEISVVQRQWVAEKLVATMCVRLCSGKLREGVWERALLLDGTMGKGM